MFIQNLYQNYTEFVEITQNILAYGNALEKVNKARQPRILYMGEGTPVLKTNNPVSWESDELDVRYLADDSNFINEYIDRDKSFETILQNKLQGFYDDLEWILPPSNPLIYKFFTFS